MTVVQDEDDRYFSKVTCDCGCGNFLPQRVLDLGRRFLRGGQHITKPRRLGTSKVIHLRAEATSIDSVLAFAVERAASLRMLRTALDIEMQTVINRLRATEAELAVWQTFENGMTAAKEAAKEAASNDSSQSVED